MIQETDDDRLDQSLRDTFSDFDLPPSHQVWTGIESRLSTLPGAPRSVPLGFVLPFVGLLGVAVGWLLPRPALTPVPRPASEVPLETRTASQQLVSPALSAYIIPRASTQALASGKPPMPGPIPAIYGQIASSSAVKGTQNPPRRAVYAAVAEPASATKAAEQATLAEASLVSTAPLTENTDLLTIIATGVESTATSVSTVLPRLVEREQQAATAHHLASAKEVEGQEVNVRGDVLRERRPEYRVPTHRLAERGRGLRRIQNTVTRQWQRVFTPRRAATAPKDF
ncbi:hypothetical protein MTX78_20585 [Hymenobacter tibetensis]|uniref:Uncharacterized protein n=1 Tax=Hymenobacter tibetensis TaxID=497967 RepID=A0ABY4CXL7_9BACT|nr:hypothetical protein [Hymenobacter tibetensis]UOG74502.1 hypothetical protein MTX78_20585 [Hymenobacter tibetensis]